MVKLPSAFNCVQNHRIGNIDLHHTVVTKLVINNGVG